MKNSIVLIVLSLWLCGTASAQSTADLQAEMCFGDSATMVITVTNADSIQWFKDGLPIAGAHDDTLVTYNSGSYYAVAFIGDSGSCFDQSGTIDIVIRWPIARDDSFSIPIAKEVLLDVLSNDNPFCGPFNYSSLRISSPPVFGRVIGVRDGKIVYRPSIQHDTDDRFGYTITDIEGRETNEAFVYIKATVECALLYPNPVTSTLYLSTDSRRFRHVEVRDVLGRVILQRELDHNQLSLDFTPYAAGTYWVKIMNVHGEGCVTKIQKK